MFAAAVVQEGRASRGAPRRVCQLVGRVLAALAGLSGAALGQDPPPAGSATITGVVYDSLGRSPLPFARVWTADGVHTTTADQRGRFVLRAVAAEEGPIAILARHPAVDSVGLGTLAAAVRVLPGATAEVVIAIPSFETLRAAACRDIPDAGDREGGILFGAVTDASSGRPISGAVARVSWLEYRGARGLGPGMTADVMIAGLDATTDASGNYYACGLTTTEELTVQADALTPDSVSSGEVPVTIGVRRIARRDILVGAPSGGVVFVEVQSTDGQPVAGARVGIDDSEPAVTNEQGWAVLHDVPTGTRTLGARGIGFAPSHAVVQVVAADTLRQVMTIGSVQQLTTMRIAGVRRLEEVQRRQETGVGYVMTGQRLADNPSLRTALQAVPSMRMGGSGILNTQLLGPGRMGGWCPTAVYLNGRKSDWMEVNMYEIDDLMALEVYPRGTGAPREYVLPDAADRCGVVLAWTKW